MVGGGSEDVIAQGTAARVADPGGVVEQGGEVGQAPVVQVEVDAPVVEEDEVADCVDALDVVAVGVVGGEEPGVVG